MICRNAYLLACTEKQGAERKKIPPATLATASQSKRDFFSRKRTIFLYEVTKRNSFCVYDIPCIFTVRLFLLVKKFKRTCFFSPVGVN